MTTEQKLREALTMLYERFKEHEDSGPAGETWQSDKLLSELALAKEALSTPPTPVDEGNEAMVRQIITIGGADFQKKLVALLDAKDAEKAVVQADLEATQASYTELRLLKEAEISSLTEKNKGLVEALVRIVKEATDPEERWANSKKVAQQALEQFGGVE